MLVLHDVRRPAAGGDVVDVALADGRVVAIGRGLASAAPWSSAERLDAQEAVLLPGFVDSHVHLTQWAAARRRIDVLSARSAAEAADLLHTAAGPGGGPRRRPRLPRRAVGHPAAPGRPRRRFATRRCRRERGPARRLGELRRGPRFGVDDPTGVLVEAPAMELMTRAGTVGDAVQDRWIAEATAAAAARGVTGLVDLEYARVDAWTARAEPAVRIAAGVWPGLAGGDHRRGGGGTGDVLAGDRVRVGPVKFVVDGSLGTRTAFLPRGVPDGRSRGPAHPAGRAGGVAAARHGQRVARGRPRDRGRRRPRHLDAFEAVGCRGSLEHAQQVHPDDVPRFRAAGRRGQRPAPPRGRRPRSGPRALAEGADRAYRFADLHAAGAELRLGSDAPVAPLDPWDALASAVHRTSTTASPGTPTSTCLRRRPHRRLRGAVAGCSSGTSRTSCSSPTTGAHVRRRGSGGVAAQRGRRHARRWGAHAPHRAERPAPRVGRPCDSDAVPAAKKTAASLPRKKAAERRTRDPASRPRPGPRRAPRRVRGGARRPRLHGAADAHARARPVLRADRRRRRRVPEGAAATWTSPSLFDERSLVLVDGVDAASEAFVEDVLEYLQAPVDTVVLVLRHRGGNRAKKVLDTARTVPGVAEVSCQPLKRDQDKVDFVLSDVRRARRSIDVEAARALVAALGSDLGELAAGRRPAAHRHRGHRDGGRRPPLPRGSARGDGLRGGRRGRRGPGGAGARPAAGAGATGVPAVVVVAALASRLRQLAKVAGAGRGRPADLARELGMAPWLVEKAQREVRLLSPDGWPRRSSPSQPPTTPSRAAGRTPSTPWRRPSGWSRPPGAERSGPRTHGGPAPSGDRPSVEDPRIRPWRPTWRWPTCGSPPGSCG